MNAQDFWAFMGAKKSNDGIDFIALFNAASSHSQHAQPYILGVLHTRYFYYYENDTPYIRLPEYLFYKVPPLVIPTGNVVN